MKERQLRAGDWVEVRSAEEILATLDAEGRLDGLPFMPEMLQYCGKRIRVYKSAHKTCDTIERYKGRRLANTVHLEELRCDGEAHGGCQAGCLLFWKTSWLRRVGGLEPEDDPPTRRAEGKGGPRCDLTALADATRVQAAGDDGTEERYRCQATELLRATGALPWWDPRQYVKDLASRNVRLRDFVRYAALAAYNAVMRLHWRLRPYPYVRGLASGETPTGVLNLQPGEVVQIRSKDEIMRTLDGNRRNRGLWFDVEMVPYCGRTFRVLRRVTQIIDEKTGRMMRLRNPCLILEGVMCSGCLSRDRLFCPRSIYAYWREIWLKRADRA